MHVVEETSYKQAPFVESWNGSSWTSSTPPAPEGPAVLKRISCVAAGECVAVGSYAPTGATGKALVERLASGLWSITQVPQPNYEKGKVELNDVVCTAANACIAVGQYPTGASVFQEAFDVLVQTWDGSQWTVRTFPAIEGMERNKLSGVSCTATWPLCTVVGGARMPLGTGSEMVTVGARFQ